MAEFQNIDTNEVEKAVSVEENVPNDVTSRTSPKRSSCSSLCSPNRQRTIGKVFYFLGVAVWFFGLVFGIYGAISVSVSTWRHYKESPTVISMERDFKEWNTSFPAVTICPNEKYDNDSLNQLVEELPYREKYELRKFLVGLSGATYNTFDLVPEFPEIDPSQYLELLLKIKFKFTYTLSGSYSEANRVALTPTITERGLCYAFNSDIAIYNSPEYWQSKSKSLIPRGWSFVGNPLDGDLFEQIMDMNSGYIAYIHGSNETADFSSQILSSSINYYKTLSMTALSVYSSDKARSLSVEQRACRFLEESSMQISPVYSYNLCRNQCRMNLAYSLCKCVPHFYKPTLSVGSSIGLFLGCSLLSLVQMAYFICACLYRGIIKILKACFGCVQTQMLGGKHRYVTSASSSRSTVVRSPLPDEFDSKILNGEGLNPTFVARHI